MRRRGWEIGWRQGVSLAVAALALVNGGCLLAAAGAAAGGAAGYAYCKGKVCDQYPASFDDTWAATHTALQELGMPVEGEERSAAGGTVHTRTADGERVRVTVDAENGASAAGPSTRVGVRVATFGDYDVSERIHSQIGAHLVASVPPGGAPPGTAAPAASLGPIRPVPPPPPGPPQTPPPPLAPAEPGKQP